MLLAPLVAALRDAGHTIGMLAGTLNRELYRDDLVRAHDADAPRALDEIRAREYDVALIATEKHRGYRFARDARVPRRIGFANGLAKPLKSLWVRSQCTEVRFRPAIGGTRHEAETLFLLGDGLVEEHEPTRDVARLRDLLIASPVRARRGTLVQLTRKWEAYGSIADLAALLRALDARVGIRCIGALAERAYLDDLEAAAELPVEKFAATRDWIDRIAHARALITPDTGAAHVAGMVGTHVVDIFADESTERLRRRWSPWASTFQVLTMSDVREAGGIARIAAALAPAPTESRIRP